MASSEQFKEALRTGKLKEALLIAMSQGFELDITTWVNSTQGQPHPPSGKRLRTRINLIRGEIDNEIGEDFLRDGVVKELEKLHSAQIATAPQILQSNLESLQKIFQLATALQEQKLGKPRAEVVIAQTPLETLPQTSPVSKQIVGETEVFPTFTETKANAETQALETPVIELEESVSVNLEFIEPEMDISGFEAEIPEEEISLDSDIEQEPEESILALETLEPEEEEGFESFETVDIEEVTDDSEEMEIFEEISPEFSSSLDDLEADSEDLSAESNNLDEVSFESVSDSSEDDWGDLLDDVSSEQNGNDKTEEWGELSEENSSDLGKSDLGNSALGLNNLDALDWDDDADWEDFDESLDSDIKSGANKN